MAQVEVAFTPRKIHKKETQVYKIVDTEVKKPLMRSGHGIQSGLSFARDPLILRIQ
jgi:hypothetical protein